MFRFIAVVWNPLSVDQSATERFIEQQLAKFTHDDGTAGYWELVHRRAGSAVFCARLPAHPRQVHGFENGFGVVIGTIFRGPKSMGGKSPSTLRAGAPSFDECTAARIRATGGQWLVDAYWGNYAAFLHTAENSVRVMRSPMSNLPVYKSQHHGVHILFSRLADFQALRVGVLSINWDYLPRCLTATNDYKETGLNEVIELKSGEAWDIGPDKVSHITLWNPLLITLDRIEDPEEAERELRNNIQACVLLWSSVYSRILVRLSGGLDSTIVLSCLREAGAAVDVTCLNGFFADAGSDERHFARIAAESASSELIEVAYSENVRLERIFDVLPFPYPLTTFPGICSDQQEAEVTRDRRIDAVFDGTDGDTLFGQSAHIHSTTDYVRTHGLRGKLWETALDAARVQRLTIWRVLLSSIAQSVQLKWNPFYDEVPTYLFLSPQVVSSVRKNDRFGFWTSAAESLGVPAGKAYHAYNLCNGYSIPYDVFEDAALHPDFVSPLCSQPVIETALRIPLYLLSESRGVRADRPLARRAFAAEIPTQILHRRGKGTPTDYVTSVMRRNLDFIRAMLLDGVLMQRGYLHKKHIQDALSEIPSGRAEGIAPLFWILCIEAWIESIGRATPLSSRN